MFLFLYITFRKVFLREIYKKKYYIFIRICYFYVIFKKIKNIVVFRQDSYQCLDILYEYRERSGNE